MKKKHIFSSTLVSEKMLPSLKSMLFDKKEIQDKTDKLVFL